MTINTDAKTTRSQSFGWHVQQLAAALDRELNAQLAPLGLNQVQFVILMKLLELGPSTQAKLAESSSIPVYAMSRGIDRLENAGFLKRQTHPTSRRAHLVHLTQKSIDTGPQLFEIVERVNARCTAGFSQDEVSQFRICVVQLTANLQAPET